MKNSPGNVTTNPILSFDFNHMIGEDSGFQPEKKLLNAKRKAGHVATAGLN
jgi:hypothetical protein